MFPRHRALGSCLEYYPHQELLCPRILNSSKSVFSSKGIEPAREMQEQHTQVLSSQQAASIEYFSQGLAQRRPPAPAFVVDNYSRPISRDFTWSASQGIVFATSNPVGAFSSGQKSCEFGTMRRYLSRRAWPLASNFQCLERQGKNVSSLTTAPEPASRGTQADNFHTSSRRSHSAEHVQTTAAVDSVRLPESLRGEFAKSDLRKSKSEGHIGSRARTEDIPRDTVDMDGRLFLNSNFYGVTKVDTDPETVDTEYLDGQDLEPAPGAAGSEHGAPHIPMSFQIPEQTKRQAMHTSRTSVAAYWSYNLYEGPNGEKVKVHYCKSKETTERVAQFFRDKEVVGFDIEWKPQAKEKHGVKDNVSLIQLACEDRIALFHIAQYSKYNTLDDLVSPTLRWIMESPTIVKAGVAIKADCTRLKRFLGIDARGIFELSHLHTQVSVASTGAGKLNKRLVALAKQVEQHLQLPMFKGDVRSSDWTKELKFEQIIYAASDSYAGLRLFETLEAKRKLLDPRPPRPHFAELSLPIILPKEYTFEIADDPVDNEGFDTGELTLDRAAGQPLDIPQNEDIGVISEKNEDANAEKTGDISLLVATQLWVDQFRDSLPGLQEPRVGRAQLRSYWLWHNSNLSVEDIARMLRDPPLKATTVANYILESIRLEKLTYDRKRVADVLKYLPPNISLAKYFQKMDTE